MLLRCITHKLLQSTQMDNKIGKCLSKETKTSQHQQQEDCVINTVGQTVDCQCLYDRVIVKVCQPSQKTTYYHHQPNSQSFIARNEDEHLYRHERAMLLKKLSRCHIRRGPKQAGKNRKTYLCIRKTRRTPASPAALSKRWTVMLQSSSLYSSPFNEVGVRNTLRMKSSSTL